MSSITNLISVGVNGTGTANSVMKWLDADTATDSIITDNGSTISIGGSLAVDTNTLYVDATNNRVGVGTTSFVSGEVLRVSGAISLPNNTPILLQDSVGNNRNAFQLSTSDILQIGSAGSGITAQTFHTSGSERMRIDSSGLVRIGDGVSTSSLQMISGTSDYFQIDSTGTITNLIAGNSTTGSAEMAFYTSSGGTESERMRILSGGGLTFNGDTAAANALDDYEEGTWSPFYFPQNGAFTAINMSVVTATYTKIGNLVIASAYLRTSNPNTSGASGIVYLGGLPFTASNQSYSGAVLSRKLDFSTPPTDGFIQAGDTYVNFMINTTAFQVSHLSSGSGSRNQLMITAVYHAA